MSVMLALTVLLEPKNGSFEGSEIEEFFFFLWSLSRYTSKPGLSRLLPLETLGTHGD